MSSKARRFEALDGLRGLFALVVITTHVLGAFEFPWSLRASLLESPFVLLLNGGGAVQLFFVLSGFVLAGSLTRNGSLRDLPQFYVRRVFRIHPPYVFALVAAWCASFFYVVMTPEQGAAQLIHRLAQVHITLGQLAKGLLFPGTGNLQLSVGWTLEIEMIFSILLPAMFLLMQRTHWSVLVALSLVPLAIGPEGHRVFKFAIDFAVGMALYQNRDTLEAWLAPLKWPAALALTLVGLFIFNAPWFLGWFPKPSGEPGSILVVALGSAILVAGSVHNGLMSAIFGNPVFHYLGRMSYSTYLFHFPVVLLCAPLVVTPDPSWSDVVLLFGLVTALSVLLSIPGYYFVELPAIRAGNRLCVRLAARMGSEAHQSLVAAQAPKPS